MHKPTHEQESALQAFDTGETLKVNAFAGTGKTTTLQMMAEGTDRKGLYIAFNKSIANEAGKKFPHTVKATTSHALAFKHVIKTGFTAEKMVGKLNVNAVVDYLALGFLQVDENILLTPKHHAHIIAETIRLFTHSSCHEINAEHVPIFGSLNEVKKDDIDHMKLEVLKKAKLLWSKMISPNDEATYLGHDGYLKLWALSNAQLKEDFIFLDEAQDSNPALLGILGLQKSQVIYVGDRFQQIYEWRGAVNGMNSISTRKEVELSQSFRFGEEAAIFNNKILQILDPKIQIKGNKNIKTIIGCSNPNTILTRTNSSLMSYVLLALKAGRKPHIIGGIQELTWMLKDVSLLKDNKAGSHPEFFGFKNWSQIKEHCLKVEGTSLQTFVNLVDKHGELTLLNALEKTCTFEEQADLILSTAHKAKGREWRSVMVDDDFKKPLKVSSNQESIVSKEKFKHKDGSDYYIEEEELRLLYVACTRASHEMQIPAWCSGFFSVAQTATKLQLLPQAKIENFSTHTVPAVREQFLLNNQPIKKEDSQPHKSNNWIIFLLAVLIIVLLIKK